MHLGEPLNGLMMNRHWRVVLDDSAGVAKAVREFDREAVLAAHDETLEIAVARFIGAADIGGDPGRLEGEVKLEHADRGRGAWMLVFRAKRDGFTMCGEPDMSVMEQLRKRDARAKRRGQNVHEIRNDFERMDREREEAAHRVLMAKTTARVEQSLHAMATARKDGSWRPGRIFVPGRD